MSRVQNQEDVLCWRWGAGWPGPHSACGHLAACVYQMMLYHFGRKRGESLQGPSTGIEMGRDQCSGHSLAEYSSGVSGFRGLWKGPVPRQRGWAEVLRGDCPLRMWLEKRNRADKGRESHLTPTSLIPISTAVGSLPQPVNHTSPWARGK